MKNVSLQKLSLLFFLITCCTPKVFGQWETELSSARYNIGIAESNGKVFFAGSSPSAEAKVIDIYDYDTFAMTTTELAVARQFTFAEAIGDKVYFAGYTQTSAEDQNMIEVYDVPSETWSTLTIPDINGPTSITSVGDLLVLVRGGSVRMYNTSNSAWSSATLSSSRILALAIGCNGKVLFSGGGSLANGVSDVVDIYDVNTDTWSTSTLSQERNGIKGACSNGKIYLVGGGVDFSVYSDAIDIYDTSTGTWSLMNMTQTKSSIGVGADLDEVYIVGGKEQVNFDYVDEIHIINSVTGEERFDQLSSPRVAVSCFGFGSLVFAAGGFDEGEVAYLPIVELWGAITTGIESPIQGPLKISPNPVADVFNITIPGQAGAREISYSIFDTKGNSVKSGVTTRAVSLSDLTAGIYFLQIQNDARLRAKVVKL